MTPVPKGRPRFTKSGIAYTPSKTREAEKLIAWEIRKQYKGEPSDKPISISMTFYMPTPKARKDIVGEPHIKRPDLDNCCKLATDACNGILWLDDSQIWAMTCEKVYSNYPHIEMQVIANEFYED